MTSGPTPASTVRWAIPLAGLHDLNGQELAEGHAGTHWLWYAARTAPCADGYPTGRAPT